VYEPAPELVIVVLPVVLVLKLYVLPTIPAIAGDASRTAAEAARRRLFIWWFPFPRRRWEDEPRARRTRPFPGFGGSKKRAVVEPGFVSEA